MNAALLTEKTAAPSVSELIDVIGAEATIRLCGTFGGHSREIGKPSEAVIAAIGLEAAKALRDYWGKGRIYIPCQPLSSKARHAEIRRLRDEGMTVQTIAGRCRISERQVYNVLASARRKIPRTKQVRIPIA